MQGMSLHIRITPEPLASSRGGGDDDGSLHDGIDFDEQERDNDSRNESNESNDAMQRLRQRWSSVPAVPSIVWPFDVDVTDADQTEESTRQQQQQQLLQNERQNQPTKAIQSSLCNVPILPRTLAHGAIVHFVCFVEGKISRIRYGILTEMKDLESVMDLEINPQFLEVGNEIHKTIDKRTDTGWTHLMNDDEEKFRKEL
jgi:hypothetical protein